MNPLTMMKFLKIGGPILLVAIVAAIAYHLAITHGLKEDILTAKADTQTVRDNFQTYKTAALNVAAERMKIEAQALETATAEFNKQLRHERELRSEAHRIAEENAQRAAIADDEIERLKNENEIVRAWAVTVIPGEWISWMHGDIDIPTTSVPTD